MENIPLQNVKSLKPVLKSKTNILLPFTAFQMNPKKHVLNTFKFPFNLVKQIATTRCENLADPEM